MLKIRIKEFLKRNYKLILLSFIIAVIGHTYFLQNQSLYDQYMMSPYDQFSQMIIFKDLLYEEFSQGNFFYSFFLNGGNNLISRLSYYYSTSLMFYATALVTFLLETFHIIEDPNMVYWASAFVFISIARSFVILLATTKYINIFTDNKKISLLAATFYAFSSIYFRHVALWEFFADAMIWLPIILIGVEYIIRKEDGKIFALGIALTMFNNGYFAFANLLFTLIYISLRFIFKLSSQESNVYQQMKNYIIYGLLGAGLSLPGFLPFVIGFFSTSRLSPEFNIPSSEFIDFELGDLLLNDGIQLLPILFIIVILYFLNYKSKKFRFFSILSFVLITLRYNPFIASLFNGLSYPQYRWHYITFLMISVVISLGVKNIIEDLRGNTKKAMVFLGLSFILTIGSYYIADSQLTEHYFNMETLYALITIMFLGFLLINIKKANMINIVVLLLFLTSLHTVFVSNEQLDDDYNLSTMNYEKIYNTFDNPNTSFEQALDIIESDSDRFYRVDYSGMPNLGSQKGFSTFNVYTSFQNKYQQYFYRYFQIINSKENNGVINGLAGRQNLSSIFQSDYVIAPQSDTYIIPTAFEEIGQADDLKVYKNQIPLAFIHPVRKLYSRSEVSKYDYKDNLIINGAIVPDELSNTTLEGTDGDGSVSEMNYVVTEIETETAGNKLLKSDHYFEVSLALENNLGNFDDLVIDYTIKPLDSSETGRYTYSINDYSIQLKSTGDPYSSQLFRHQVHVPYNEEISFNLAPGTDYIFEIHAVYGVSHDELIERSKKDISLDYDVKLDGGNIDIQFNNIEEFPFMVLPLFYEEKWEVQINGVEEEVLNVNNGMVGFEIPPGELNIQLEFNQPFLEGTIIVAILSLFVLIYKDKSKNNN